MSKIPSTKKKNCLSCKYFRLEDSSSGVCRVDKSVEQYPIKNTEENCGEWVDSGQQYYIRLGWIKKRLYRQGISFVRADKLLNSALATKNKKG